MTKRAFIIDATLREGNQSPDVRFTPDSSVRIARQLAALGVDMIEAGHPFCDLNEMSRVKAVVKTMRDTPAITVLAHARAMISDVQAALESGAHWVGLFAGVNDVSVNDRLRKSRGEILERVQESVSFAKRNGLKVRYTVEDSSRTPLNLLLHAYQTAISSGADRICFADSVGGLSPRQMRESVSAIKKEFPNTPLEVHCHNDRGLALANSLEALHGGAEWISSSINGLGERVGICDTLELLTNLSLEELRPAQDIQTLLTASRLVASLSETYPDVKRPIVGKHAFVHTCDLHVKAVQSNSEAYSPFGSRLRGIQQVIHVALKRFSV